MRNPLTFVRDVTTCKILTVKTMYNSISTNYLDLISKSLDICFVFSFNISKLIKNLTTKYKTRVSLIFDVK